MSISRLYDLGLEFKALKTVIEQESEYSGKLLSVLKKEHFHNKATKTFFEKIQTILDGGVKELPSFYILVDDSSFKDEIKEVLKSEYSTTPTIKTKGDYDYVVNNLNTLYVARTVYQGAYKAATDLTEGNSQDPIDLSPILNHLETTLMKAKSKDESGEQVILGSGYNEEAAKVFYDVVYAPESGSLLRTGFQEFDDMAGGFEKGNLVVVGANSGGGKSQFAINLMVRQYRMGYNVAVASYEMKAREIMQRVYSNISEIEMNKIRLKKMTLQEQKKLEYCYREFVLVGEEKGNYFRIDCPVSEETVNQVGHRLFSEHRANPPDVIIFDYINLLTTASTYVDSQWQALGEIAREAKILANQLNCVIVLLAQIDDAYNLRYSKAIKDHANYLMGWIYDEQAKLDNVVTVRQMKARNSPPVDFNLVTRFDIAQFRNIGEEDRNLVVTQEMEDALLEKFKAKKFLYGETAEIAAKSEASSAAKNVLGTEETLDEITPSSFVSKNYDEVVSTNEPVILTK